MFKAPFFPPKLIVSRKGTIVAKLEPIRQQLLMVTHRNSFAVNNELY